MRNALTKVHVGKTDGGKFAAATTSSPFFLFEGDSEEEVLAIVRRALAFYASADKVNRDSNERERGKSLSTFYPSRVVEVEEDCAAA